MTLALPNLGDSCAHLWWGRFGRSTSWGRWRDSNGHDSETFKEQIRFAKGVQSVMRCIFVQSAMCYLGPIQLGQYQLRPVPLRPGATWAKFLFLFLFFFRFWSFSGVVLLCCCCVVVVVGVVGVGLDPLKIATLNPEDLNPKDPNPKHPNPFSLLFFIFFSSCILDGQKGKPKLAQVAPGQSQNWPK